MVNQQEAGSTDRPGADRGRRTEAVDPEDPGMVERGAEHGAARGADHPAGRDAGDSEDDGAWAARQERGARDRVHTERDPVDDIHLAASDPRDSDGPDPRDTDGAGAG